jgi:hypothetical protein
MKQNSLLGSKLNVPPPLKKGPEMGCPKTAGRKQAGPGVWYCTGWRGNEAEDMGASRVALDLWQKHYGPALTFTVWQV